MSERDDWLPFDKHMLEKPDANPIELLKENVQECIQDIQRSLEWIDGSHVLKRIKFSLMFTGGQWCGDEDPHLEICAVHDLDGAIAAIDLRDWLKQIISYAEDCTVEEEIKALEDVRNIIDQAIEERTKFTANPTIS